MKLDLNKFIEDNHKKWEEIKKTPRIVRRSWFNKDYELANLGDCSYFKDNRGDDLIIIHSNAFPLSLSKPAAKFIDDESIKKIEAIENRIKELKANLQVEVNNAWKKSKKIVWIDDLIK